MAQDEQVLVVQRKVFESAGAFNGLAMDTQKYLDKLFAPGVPRFMPRPQAEKDPSFKQLIPYVRRGLVQANICILESLRWNPTPENSIHYGSKARTCCYWWATEPRWGWRLCTRGFPTRTAKHHQLYPRFSPAFY